MALAVGEVLPEHPYERFSAASSACRICGLDPDFEPEELHEGGQLLPGDLEDALRALTYAEKHLGEAPSPRAQDVASLDRLFALVASLPASAREGKLVDAMTKAKLVVGNRYDRRHVVETLGSCGILETPEHPGFTTCWTTFEARQARPSSQIECDPPIAFWQARHGVSVVNVRGWFGHLGVGERLSSRG
jgi:hypothetical protein